MCIHTSIAANYLCAALKLPHETNFSPFTAQATLLLFGRYIHWGSSNRFRVPFFSLLDALGYILPPPEIFFGIWDTSNGDSLFINLSQKRKKELADTRLLHFSISVSLIMGFKSVFFCSSNDQLPTDEPQYHQSLSPYLIFGRHYESFWYQIYPFTIIMYPKVHLAKTCSLRKKTSEFMAVFEGFPGKWGREGGGHQVINNTTSIR